MSTFLHPTYAGKHVKLSVKCNFNATSLFFRSIRFEYDSQVDVDGARGYRYKLTERLVSNSTIEPDNACFNPSPTLEQVNAFNDAFEMKIQDDFCSICQMDCSMFLLANSPPLLTFLIHIFTKLTLFLLINFKKDRKSLISPSMRAT